MDIFEVAVWLLVILWAVHLLCLGLIFLQKKADQALQEGRESILNRRTYREEEKD